MKPSPSSSSPSSLSSFHQYKPPLIAGILVGSVFSTILGAVVMSGSKSPVAVEAPVTACRKKLAENLGYVFASEQDVYGKFSPVGEGQTIEVAARVGNILCHARLALDETLTDEDSEGAPEGGK